MTEKHKALGRGLESLLPSRPVPYHTIPGTLPGVHPGAVPFEAPTVLPASGEKEPDPSLPEGGAPGLPGEVVQEISLDHLDPNPYQTRSQMDEEALVELRESIMALGVIEPIIVRPTANGRYQVIAGERRWRAAHMAFKETIPAVLRHVSDQQAMEMMIVENLQREDLSILDQARAFQRLSQEFGLTQDVIAERTGKDRSTVANYMRLLKLPEEVQQLVDEGNLSFGHAKVLMTMPGSAASLMAELARRIIKRELTVRQTEDAVAQLEARPAARKERIVDPNVRAAEDSLRRALGVRVTIKDHKGRGRIVLEYRTLEDFDRIVEAVTNAKK
jgi:ParB family transcriptional regulator, chromosome partitioning protein